MAWGCAAPREGGRPPIGRPGPTRSLSCASAGPMLQHVSLVSCQLQTRQLHLHWGQRLLSGLPADARVRPYAGEWFRAIPADADYAAPTLAPLGVALAASPAAAPTCDHRAACAHNGRLARRAPILARTWVRVAREAVGAEGRVMPQQWLSHTTAPGIPADDRRRLDFVLYGSGEALCWDVTLASPLRPGGRPQPGSRDRDGAAIKGVRRRSELGVQLRALVTSVCAGRCQQYYWADAMGSHHGHITHVLTSRKGHGVSKVSRQVLRELCKTPHLQGNSRRITALQSQPFPNYTLDFRSTCSRHTSSASQRTTTSHSPCTLSQAPTHDRNEMYFSHEDLRQNKPFPM